MDKVSNWKRLRREYLWQKVEAYGYVALFIGLIAGTTVCMVNDAILFSQQGYLSYIVLAALLGLGAMIHVNSIRKVGRMLKDLPYVPPVVAEALPAEEVLVRSSDEPPHMSCETLLRPAGGQEAKTGDLLHILH
jgi:hypothetical protein